MVTERAQRKTFQQSREEIVERMKEKRNKRLASATHPSRVRSRHVNKSSATTSTNSILKGVQMNNHSLALALQAEKEKLRQANDVILQLKREQQALFLHLLLLKRKLREQEVPAPSDSEREPTNIQIEQEAHLESHEAKQTTEKITELHVCEPSPICAVPKLSENRESESDKLVNLPSTVNVRRRQADRRSRRRSDLVQVPQSLHEADVYEDLEALRGSPAHTDTGNETKEQRAAEPDIQDAMETEESQSSTPRLPPSKSSSNQPGKKRTQHQSNSKPEQAARKPDRGRKPERALLKKPWENPKPRARSKSRDRSATRAKAAPPAAANKLNTSLGCNDIFDFDCEESTHVNPFRAKDQETQSAAASSEETPCSQQKASPEVCSKDDISSSSLSSETEDSPYIPAKTLWKQEALSNTKVIATRRGWRSKEDTGKENTPSKQNISGGLGVRRAGRGLSLCDVNNLSPAAFHKFPRMGSHPSDSRCSSPVPARKRRCTMVVDYKEPSLSTKLRRGDKHTDMQFLRSPIFKSKSGRRSVKRSRSSSQLTFEKYNESFVGCR